MTEHTRNSRQSLTDETMALRGLLEKSSDAELLCEIIGFAAERLMALEMGGLTGAAHGERSEGGINHRRCHESLHHLTPADVYFGRG